MKKIWLLLIAVVSASVANAGNITTLVMGLDVGNGFVAAGGPSRVRVPPGETVRMLTTNSWGVPLQWRKNGVAIPGATQEVLSLYNVTSADNGEYTVTGIPYPWFATGIRLEVVAAGTAANFSSRLLLQPGADTQIIGFVVTGVTPKKLLVRAVGPTLASFGVGNPAAQPRIVFYDSKGAPINWVRPAVVLPPEYWAGVFGSAGAFPLTGGEAAYLSYDLATFAPGTYSILVSDADKKGGIVLVEIYDVP